MNFPVLLAFFLFLPALSPSLAQAQNCVIEPNNDPVWSDQFVMPTPAPVPESELPYVTGGDDVGVYTGPDGDENEPPEEGLCDKQDPPKVDDPECQKILDLAYQQLCKPYVYGASGPNSFDCSGFTKYVFRNAAGVELPHGSTSTYEMDCITKIAPNFDEAKPCDLIFWRYPNATKATSHIGIYVGGKSAIHAGSPVKVSYLPEMNWLKRYILAFGRVECK